MPPDSHSRIEPFLRHAPLTAAVLAAVAALPGLWLPFLADDWGLLADAARGSLARTPFGYFRPLTALTFRAELLLWGARPFFFHLTNLLLAAACAALLAIVLRRLTGDAQAAAFAAAIFALHPYHAETVWWVAGRADLLACLFLLAALLAYERWRATLRGIPAMALLLFAAGLLSKEAAISFPLLLLLIELVRGSREDRKAACIRGALPVAALALLYALVIRPVFLGGDTFANLRGTLPHWIANLFAFMAGSLVPLHTEFLEGHPLLYGSFALAAAGSALVWAFRNDRPRARLATAAGIAFLALIGPSLLSFQERYLTLPSTAVALLIAVLGGALPRPIVRGLGFALAALWLGSLGWHAVAWTDAGRVSELLIEGLKAASLRQQAARTLVANMPHRVHGVAVAANFQEAVELSGGRAVPIQAVTALDLPSSGQDGLAGGAMEALARVAGGVVVRLQVPPQRFSRVVLPLAGRTVARDEAGEWEVAVEDGGSLLVKFPLPSTSAILVWTAGGLRALQ